jgi:hypothetical protein
MPQQIKPAGSAALASVLPQYAALSQVSIHQASCLMQTAAAKPQPTNRKGNCGSPAHAVIKQRLQKPSTAPTALLT